MGVRHGDESLMRHVTCQSPSNNTNRSLIIAGPVIDLDSRTSSGPALQVVGVPVVVHDYDPMFGSKPSTQFGTEPSDPRFARPSADSPRDTGVGLDWGVSR